MFENKVTRMETNAFIRVLKPRITRSPAKPRFTYENNGKIKIDKGGLKVCTKSSGSEWGLVAKQ